MSSPFNEEKYKALLEGLEIHEVLLSEIKTNNAELRIEAEHYQKKYLNLINILSKCNCLNLSELVSKPIQTGHTPSMKNESFYGGEIKFIKTDNLRNNEIKPPFSHYLSEIGNAQIKRTELKENDIITTIIGATYDVIARSCIIRKDVLPANINQNIAHIRPNKERISPEYLNIYLNSKYGKMYMEYMSRQMEQVNLNCEEVGKIKVPLFSNIFETQIEEIVQSAHDKASKSCTLYLEAENVLLSELGLKDWHPNNNPVNIKQLKESFLASGRLDAEYYQLKYEDYSKFIKSYKGGSDALANICFVNDKNFNPSDDSEYKYIELSNIGNSGEITGCTISVGAELPSRARRLVRANDVIVSSIEGSLQSVALVTDEYDKAICSTGFYVIKSKTLNPETLLVLFKSEPIQNLLKQGCSGTILTAIGRNELQNIVMPKIRNEVQTEIAAYVQKSISLRNEAKQLLESAKLKVEDAIFTPPHLIDNQLVTKYNKMVEESAYYYRLAEWTLLQEMYSEIWVTDTTANYSIKNYSVCKASGRLDAEYYQPKYDALFAQLSKHECDTIKDIAHVKKSVEPGSEAYQDSGIPFVRVSDVTKFGISDPNIYLSPGDFSLNELRPKKDTILLSKDGSVGIAYKVEEDLDCITSGALLHLSVFNEDYTPDYLTLVLNSIVVQMQAERDSNGAIIQHWKPSEIEQVIIPKLPKPIQEIISAKIQESFTLKAESKRLLDEAKMMVEREIEKGGK